MASLLVAAAPVAALGGEARVPALAPATEARVPVTARDLVEVAEISAPTISPDGRRVAYRVSRPSVADNKIKLDWYIADLDRKTRIHVGSGGVAQHEGSGGLARQVPVWDCDSQGLRFRALVDGAVGIWHWREDHAARLEVLDEADIIDFALSTDGGTLRYTTGATRDQIAAAERRVYEDGALVDHQLDIMQPIAGGVIEDGERIMQRLPTKWFERARLLWDTPKKVTYTTTAGRTPTENSPARRDAQFSSSSHLQGKTAIAPNGDQADVRDDGKVNTVVVTRANGDRISCTAVPCLSARLTALDWRPRSDALLLFEKASGGRENVWLWQVGAARARLLATTDGDLRASYFPPRCVPAEAALVCVEGRPVSPPRLIRIDYASGRSTVLDDPNSNLRSRTVARAREFELGRNITGILLRPPRVDRPLPLVVQYYHCDGFLKGGTGDEIPMLPLVEHGIAVLCLNRVRSPTSAKMDDSYRRALAQINKAIDRLAKDGVIDPKRVGIGGLSFGSEVALWSVRHSDRFAAATLSSGQLSTIYYWANALPGRGFADMLRDFWEVGDPEDDAARWKALAPEGDVDAIDTPLLMQLPESEGRYIIEFHTKLKQAGKAADLFLFADEPHIKYQPVHKLAVYERNLDWYRFWLKGDEDPDPGKAEQYARWRSYRAKQTFQVPAS